MDKEQLSERRRAANGWLLLGGLQAVMGFVIGVWMIAEGRMVIGTAALSIAVFVVAAVWWKRARLVRGGGD